MSAKLKITQKSIVAMNKEGEELIMSLKIFVKMIDAKTLVQLSEVVEKDPSLITQAMKFKHVIGI